MPHIGADTVLNKQKNVCPITKKAFPNEAIELFKAAESNAAWRHKSYERLTKTEFVK